jgi:hypothetical protein
MNIFYLMHSFKAHNILILEDFFALDTHQANMVWLLQNNLETYKGLDCILFLFLFGICA